MVRTYKRKTDRADIDEESMAAAIKKVLEENVSVCSSVRKYGVNNQTLNSRLRKIRKSGNTNSPSTSNASGSKYASKTVFNTEQESN